MAISTPNQCYKCKWDRLDCMCTYKVELYKQAALKLNEVRKSIKHLTYIKKMSAAAGKFLMDDIEKVIGKRGSKLK